MRSSLNIRTKVILAIVIFISLLFAVIELQRADKIQQYLLGSETSKQKLLVRTILPILSTNLAFGLQDSTRFYLDGVTTNNHNIEFMLLKENGGNTLYQFSRNNHLHTNTPNETKVILQPIRDELTGKSLGTLEIRFSNLYYLRLLEEHRAFSLKIYIMLLAAMGFFVLFLNRAFKPLRTLKEQVEAFDPQNNSFRMERTNANDEIGIIQNALADMIYRVRLYTQELDLFTNNLECTVEERTNELSRRKEELETINGELEAMIKEVKTQEDMLISQSRLAAMGEMMSMIAHQWRQPLATMSLMISNYNISALLNDTQRDERDKIMENISDTLGYLSSTVDDFQTYFKPENRVEEHTICNIIQRAVEFSRVRIDYSKIMLLNNCSKEINVTVHTNELIQVLINIINNAIDAINTAHSRQREITIEADEMPETVTISISDTGGGIAEKIIDKIFEPYFSTKSKNGTGLGLYMAKMIITRHEEGTITAENLGQGTRFTISLPKKRTDRPENSL